MASDREDNLDDLLKRAGFTHMDPSSDSYIMSNPSQKYTEISPIIVERWEIQVQNSQWYTNYLRFNVDLNHLGSYVKNKIQNKFDSAYHIDWICSDNNGVWIIIEFLSNCSIEDIFLGYKNGRIISNQGLVGAYLSFQSYEDYFSLNLSNLFFIGEVPELFLVKLPSIIHHAFDHDFIKEYSGFFERVMDPELIALSIIVRDIKSRSQLLKNHDKQDRDHSIKISLKEEKLIVETGPEVNRNNRIPPILEIMEDRETREVLQKIDLAIINEKYDDAKKLCCTPPYIHDPNAMKRLALLDVGDYNFIDEEWVFKALGRDSNMMLYLSLGTIYGDNHFRLENISTIGQILNNQIENLSNLKTSEVVMVEALGDLWENIDPHTSKRCLDRITNLRQGSLKHIIKSSMIARKLNDNAEESLYLENASKMVNHNKFKSLINIRLSEIYKDLNREKSIKHAQEAMALDRSNLHTADYLSNLLLESNKFLQAINVIDEAIHKSRSHSHKVSEQDISKLELKIGNIWINHLGREDLAHKRFNRVLDMGISDHRILSNLVDYFSTAGDSERLYRSLEILFLKAISTKDRHLVEQYLEQIEVLSNKYQTFRECIGEWYQHYLDNFFLGPEKYFQILDRDDLQIKWDQVLKYIENHITGIVANRDDYYKIIARISQEKISNHILTLKYYEILAQNNNLSDNQFDLFEQLLKEKNDISKLAFHLKKRLNYCSQDEKVSIFRKLCHMNSNISDIEKDQYATSLFINNFFDDSEIESRFQHYKESSKYKEILDLVDYLIEHVEDKEYLKKWMKLAQSILEKHSGDFYKTNILYIKYMETIGIETDFLEHAVEQFKDSSDNKLLLPYIRDLIERGIIPNLNHNKILSVLDGLSYERGKYFECLYLKGQNEQEKIYWARKSWYIFQSDKEYIAQEASACHHLSSTTKMTDKEFERAEYIKHISQDWAWFHSILKNQLELSKGLNDRNILLKKILSYNEEFKLSHREIRDYSTTLIRGISNPVEEIFFLANYGITHVPKKEIYPYITLCFNEFDTWKYPEKMKPILTWVFQNVKEISDIKTRVTQKTHEYLEDHYDLYLRYEPVLDELNLINLAMAWRSFIKHCNKKNIKGIRFSWFKCISLSSNVDDARKYLQRLKTSLREYGYSDLFLKFLKECADVGFPYEVPFAIESEVKLEFAITIFNKNESMQHYGNILKNHFELMPDDYRTWIPLYFIYKETGDIYLIELLTFILPELRKNQSLLKNSPLTLESLEREYKELKSGKYENMVPKEGPYAQYEKDPNIFHPTVPTDEIKPSRSTKNLHRIESNGDLASKRNSGIIISSIEEGKFYLNQPATVREMLYAYKDYEYRHTENFSIIDRGIDDAILGQFSIIQSSSIFERELSLIVDDWRQTIRSLSYTPGMTEKIINTAFERRLEKHIAIQCFALISGETDYLDSWSFKPWREPSKTSYPFEIGRRIGQNQVHPFIRGHLQNLLMILSPVISGIYRKRLSLENIAKKAGISVRDLIDKRKPLRWGDSFFEKVGISIYRDRLNRDHLVIFSLEGLGPGIYYDNDHKAIYFDGIHYKNEPVSFIFHRILVVVRAVKTGFYPILKLHPEHHILPIIKETLSIVSSKSYKKISNVLLTRIGKQEPTLSAIIESLDTARLESLFEKVGHIDASRIKKQQSILWSHLYKAQMAESLDIIGIIESITGRNLLESPPEPKEIVSMSRYIPSLLEVATYLNIEMEEDQ